MNTSGNVTAFVGSIGLNVALALALSQGAGAATPAAKTELRAEPATRVVQVDDHKIAAEHCRSALRTRALVAVLLAMIV